MVKSKETNEDLEGRPRNICDSPDWTKVTAGFIAWILGKGMKEYYKTKNLTTSHKQHFMSGMSNQDIADYC